MATELANLALNYDSKEAFLAAEYKGLLLLKN
jgi:hypothetical protein